jgi:hypothetical protein
MRAVCSVVFPWRFPPSLAPPLFPPTPLHNVGNYGEGGNLIGAYKLPGPPIPQQFNHTTAGAAEVNYTLAALLRAREH